MDQNFSMICRLCSKFHENTSNIFTKDDNEISLFMKIQTLCPILIYEEDPLSKMVCQSCAIKIDNFYEFTLTALRTNLKLFNQLKTQTNEDGLNSKKYLSEIQNLLEKSLNEKSKTDQSNTEYDFSLIEKDKLNNLANVFYLNNFQQYLTKKEDTLNISSKTNVFQNGYLNKSPNLSEKNETESNDAIVSIKTETNKNIIETDKQNSTEPKIENNETNNPDTLLNLALNEINIDQICEKLIIKNCKQDVALNVHHDAILIKLKTILRKKVLLNNIDVFRQLLSEELGIKSICLYPYYLFDSKIRLSLVGDNVDIAVGQINSEWVCKTCKSSFTSIDQLALHQNYHTKITIGRRIESKYWTDFQKENCLIRQKWLDKVMNVNTTEISDNDSVASSELHFAGFEPTKTLNLHEKSISVKKKTKKNKNPFCAPSRRRLKRKITKLTTANRTILEKNKLLKKLNLTITQKKNQLHFEKEQNQSSSPTTSSASNQDKIIETVVKNENNQVQKKSKDKGDCSCHICGAQFTYYSSRAHHIANKTCIYTCKFCEKDLIKTDRAYVFKHLDDHKIEIGYDEDIIEKEKEEFIKKCQRSFKRMKLKHKPELVKKYTFLRQNQLNKVSTKSSSKTEMSSENKTNLPSVPLKMFYCKQCYDLFPTMIEKNNHEVNCKNMIETINSKTSRFEPQLVDLKNSSLEMNPNLEISQNFKSSSSQSKVTNKRTKISSTNQFIQQNKPNQLTSTISSKATASSSQQYELVNFNKKLIIRVKTPEESFEQDSQFENFYHHNKKIKLESAVNNPPQTIQQNLYNRRPGPKSAIKKLHLQQNSRDKLNLTSSDYQQYTNLAQSSRASQQSVQQSHLSKQIPKRIKCHSCNAFCRNKSELYNHKLRSCVGKNKLKRPNPKWHCSNCGKDFHNITGLMLHKKSNCNNNPKMFECPFCSLQFSSEYEYSDHIVYMHP